MWKPNSTHIYIEFSGEYLGVKFKEHTMFIESIDYYLDFEADPEHEKVKNLLVHIIPSFVAAKGNFELLKELLPEEFNLLPDNLILRVFAYTVNKLSPESIELQTMCCKDWVADIEEQVEKNQRERNELASCSSSTSSSV